MGVNVLWESQLEYYVCHNNWAEVSKLLEVIPSYALSSGSLSISMDGLHSASSIEYGGELSEYNYPNFLEELDAVCMNVPRIRVFRFPTNNVSSSWLRMLMEQQLAKKFIFLKDFWHCTAEVVYLLARSGFILGMPDNSFLDGSVDSSSDSILVIGDVSVNPDAVQALHKVFIHFCGQYNLLNLLDVYLDHHKLGADQNYVSVLQDAAVSDLIFFSVEYTSISLSL